jgi:hypothetical protein
LILHDTVKPVRGLFIFITFGAMKTIYIILIFAAAFLALFEQSKANSNVFIMVGAMALFVIGLAKLMSKVPSKGEQKNDEENDNENV